jgi:hypothetical protein
MSSSLSIDTEPYSTGIQYETMNGESWQLVTNEPVEFDNTTAVENIAKKELQSFAHCGFFDHLDLHSLNDFKFVLLVYQLKF